MTLLITSFGCGPPRPASPLRSLHYSSGTSRPSTAVLFMPGPRSRADDFASEGFVKAVQDLRLDVELVAVDAHLGYYLQDGYKTLPARMHQDVVVPAMARGQQKVWLVGTSLGALGSLTYAQRYPQAVAGVVLLGPYLGEEPMLNEIESAGGLVAWSPINSAGSENEVRTWSWLRAYSDAITRPPIEIYLAYGERDAYARASHLLAAVLPKDHVLADFQGKGEWSTWLDLWKRFLARSGHRLEQEGPENTSAN